MTTLVQDPSPQSPAAAILESDGKLLFTQKNQEFEKARSLAPEDVLAFVNKWKPVTTK